MPGKPLSERVKKQKWNHIREAKIKDAVEAYQHEQNRILGLGERRKSSHDISKEFFGEDNQYKTIQNRSKGGQSAAEVHQEQQKLAPAEEATLVKFLNESGKSDDCAAKQGRLVAWARITIWTLDNLQKNA